MRTICAFIVTMTAWLTATAAVPRLVDVCDSIDFGRDTIGGNTCQFIIIHSSYYAGDDHSPFWREGVVAQWREYDVSPHYYIDRDGTVYKMAPDTAVCWHAGKSLMPGTDRDSLNFFSIGIELINSKKTGPSNAQYISLAWLLDDLTERHDVTHIAGHADIAPGRKTDPWQFSWQRLATLVAPRTRDAIIPHAAPSKPKKPRKR